MFWYKLELYDCELSFASIIICDALHVLHFHWCSIYYNCES